MAIDEGEKVGREEGEREVRYTRTETKKEKEESRRRKVSLRTIMMFNLK